MVSLDKKYDVLTISVL